MQRTTFLRSLSNEDAAYLLFDWQFWARPEQIAPSGDWYLWLILAGRGFGKTRTGAEQVRRWVQEYAIVNLIGATADDARDIMIDGESGILAICPPWERPIYKKSERRLDWPNGARSLVFTADEPERLRGKQHMKLWADELCAWRHPDAWDQAMFGLRLGDSPQAIVTTTPKPTKQLKELMRDPKTHITHGSTYDNRQNLAADFFKKIISKYEGTRLGRQELNAEILSDVPGALWQRDLIERQRVITHPPLVRIVVAVDPEASSESGAAETGIIAAGLGTDGHGYLIADNTVQGMPAVWGKAATDTYTQLAADVIVGEVNNGGEMVGYVILSINPRVNYKAVHASRGKYTRAEPISALYERGLVHHVGAFPELEDQMCTWVPGEKSPDRMDAAVWALTELFYEFEPQDEDDTVVYDDRVNISEY